MKSARVDEQSQSLTLEVITEKKFGHKYDQLWSILLKTSEYEYVLSVAVHALYLHNL